MQRSTNDDITPAFNAARLQDISHLKNFLYQKCFIGEINYKGLITQNAYTNNNKNTETFANKIHLSQCRFLNAYNKPRTLSLQSDCITQRAGVRLVSTKIVRS